MVVAWLVVAALLVFVELHNTALFAAFGAAGCGAAAVTAAVQVDPLAGGSIVVQVVVAVLVALAGIALVRPWVNRRFHRHQSGHVGVGVHGGLVGQEAVTLDLVGDLRHPGHVRLAGERWLALSAGGTVIPDGTQVYVTEVRGTTLVVWPSRELFGPESFGPEQFPGS